LQNICLRQSAYNQSPDIGLGQVDYLPYNPSNGYLYGVDSYKGNIILLDSSGIKGNLSTGYKVDYLAYNPMNRYMYAAGNEHREPKKDHYPYSLSNNSRPSSGLQPFAQNQQFNNDVGNGPICCDISGSFTITRNMYQFIILPFNRTDFLDDYLKVMDLLVFD
jgi:hypothetical protein